MDVEGSNSGEWDEKSESNEQQLGYFALLTADVLIINI